MNDNNKIKENNMAAEAQNDTPVVTGLVIKPGDSVLLTTGEDWSAEHAQNVMHALRDRFPDAEFTIISGISGLAVYEGDSNAK